MGREKRPRRAPQQPFECTAVRMEVIYRRLWPRRRHALGEELRKPAGNMIQRGHQRSHRFAAVGDDARHGPIRGCPWESRRPGRLRHCAQAPSAPATARRPSVIARHRHLALGARIQPQTTCTDASRRGSRHHWAPVGATRLVESSECETVATPPARLKRLSPAPSLFLHSLDLPRPRPLLSDLPSWPTTYPLHFPPISLSVGHHAGHTALDAQQRLG